MKILSLERLVGPGRSIDENFEILCLESIKAANGPAGFHSYRVSPPDKGVDIFSESEDGILHAYQCKAYAKYSSGLITELKKSIDAADKNYDNKPWDLYLLMIPFVPTAVQREKLETALQACKGKTYIVDGDELETRLFEFPEITARFFPSVIMIIPPHSDQLVLKTDDPREMIQVTLESERTGQRIPVSVSPNVTCDGLLNYLSFTLKLPNSIKVLAGRLLEEFEEIQWILSVVRRDTETYLEPNITLEESGVSKDDILRLRFKLTIKVEYGYQKPFGLKDWVVLGSNIWADEEMGVDLIRHRKSYPVEQQKRDVIEEYIGSHLSMLSNLIDQKE